MMRSALILGVWFALAGCGRGEGANPPTEPADPLTTPEATAPAAGPASDPVMPGTGPASFVGRWAADARWCANTQGAERAVVITPFRFEGYENACDLADVAQVAGGYEARLQCVAEGQARTERARFTVSGQTLDIAWLDRNQRTRLLKCTTLADPGPTPGLSLGG
jgi:hypothetical protein